MPLKFESVDQIAQCLNQVSACPFTTVRDVVNEIIDIGYSDKVWPFHDSHRGLSADLPQDFLNMNLLDLDVEVESEQYADEVDTLCNEAAEVIGLYFGVLTEEHHVKIREDRQCRGLCDYD